MCCAALAFRLLPVLVSFFFFADSVAVHAQSSRRRKDNSGFMFCLAFRLIIQDLKYLRTCSKELRVVFFYLFTLLSPSTRLMASTDKHYSY